MCAPGVRARPGRWRAFATAIARTVELPEPLVEQVEHCALLHDIGKLAIPDPEIEADGAQGELQSTLRRQHVRIGFDILSVVPTPATRCRAADRGVRALRRQRLPVEPRRRRRFRSAPRVIDGGRRLRRARRRNGAIAPPMEQ